MIRRPPFAAVATVAAAIAGAAPIVAQTIDVRSGEHDSFTRLVFYLDEPRDWTLGRTDAGYQLGLDGPAPAFDTEDVFDFIPRRRLLDVRPADDGLSFEVSCPCHVNAFEYRENILVVDFRDGPAPDGSRFEAPFAPPREPTADISLPPLPTPVAPIPTAPAEPELPSSPTSVPAQSLPTLFAAPDPLASAELRQELATGISRAIAEGFATPVDPMTTSPEAAARGSGPFAELATSGARIDLRTARDPLPSPSADPSTRECLNPDNVDVRAWGGGRTPAEVLSQTRAGFLEDLDTPSDTAVLDRARAYAFLGFGAEARQVLRAYPVGGEAARAVAAIAGILDDPGTPGPDWLARQAACDSVVALWGLLAMDPNDPPTSPNAAAVQRALSALPLHLRTHLAPTVSERLRRTGDTSAAAAARATITRVVDEPPGALVVETARAEREAAARSAGSADAVPGDDPARLQQLDQASAGNDVTALAAQAELLRRIAGAERPVSPELRNEVAAQIHSAGDIPEARDLLDALIAAMARGGQYRAALDYLEELARRGRADRAALTAGVDQVFRALVNRAGDGVFLTVAATRAADALPAPPSPPVSLLVAARLEALGFPEAAAGFAAPPAEIGPPDPERQRQLAARALASGQPNEALARLSGLTDARALELSAEALLALGAPAEAGRLFERLGRDEDAARAYWSAGQWDRAAELTPEPRRRELARRLAGTNDDPASVTLPPVLPGTGGIDVEGTVTVPPPQPVVEPELRLSDAEALIADSADLRGLADDLLANP